MAIGRIFEDVREVMISSPSIVGFRKEGWVAGVSCSRRLSLIVRLIETPKPSHGETERLHPEHQKTDLGVLQGPCCSGGCEPESQCKAIGDVFEDYKSNQLYILHT